MAAITRVPLSLCSMLEDDLKISSDEEEAEQKVSSRPFIYLCKSPLAPAFPPNCPPLNSCIRTHYMELIFVYVTFTDSLICPEISFTHVSESYSQFISFSRSMHPTAFIYVPPQLGL